MLTDRGRELSRSIVQPVALALGRTGLTPDMLTVGGFLLHVPVAWLLATGQLLAGAVMLAAAAVFDAFDGALARATGRVSPGGALLDSSLDRMSEMLTFLGLLVFVLHNDMDAEAILLYLAVTGSVMVSYTRARSEALGCGTKAGILGRFERMLLLIIGLALGWVRLTLALLALGAWVTALMRIADARSKGRPSPTG